MNFVSFAFYAVFGTNILLHWGVIPHSMKFSFMSWQRLLIITIVTTLFSLLQALFFRYVLQPFGLINLLPVFYFAFFSLSMFLYLIYKKYIVKSELVFMDFFTEPVSVSLLVYLGVLIAGMQQANLTQIMGIGFFSVLGYCAAAILVNDIMERLELQDIPYVFRGYPILFITVGLILLAFSGLDKVFFYGIFNKL
ncbi:MAG: hypothetical protein KKC64_03180 [Spirochaetes bacterium]|nr:hypothetical protein [Spirochaetota bacterium]